MKRLPSSNDQIHMLLSGKSNKEICTFGRVLDRREICFYCRLELAVII